ncbi:MAG TPA: hypothetical protein VGM13_15540 [Thermoanaerobaculia bacterium]
MRPAAADTCKLVNFLLNQGQTPVTREKIAFSLGFRPARGFNEASASATVDWGDGTVENTGPRTIRMGIMTATTLRLEHAYPRPGKFVAKVRAGALDGASCSFENWFFPAEVTVAENPVHARAAHAVPAQMPAAFSQKKAAVLPTPTPALVKTYSIAK